MIWWGNGIPTPRDGIKWKRDGSSLIKVEQIYVILFVNVGSTPAVNTKNIKNNENYLEISKIFVIFVL